MKLELASFPVRNIVSGHKTAYQDRILTVNEVDLISLVKQDKRIATVDIELVRPGDRTRIVGVRDVVEPRAKSGEEGSLFPGILGPLRKTGMGKTHRLSGIGIVTSVRYTSHMRSSSGGPNASILDMWGPGAAAAPFGRLHNIVLLLELVDGLAEFDAHLAIQMAQLRLAQALAQTTLDLKAPQREILELTPAPAGLPKVVYIVGYLADPANPHPGLSLYGMPIKESLPTLLHPNEFFDGAVTPDGRKGDGNYPRTWDWQNHPVIQALYEEHGKRLNFLGVIFQRIRYLTYAGKEVAAIRTETFAKMLGAQAAIVTRMVSSGNMLIDSMLTIQACEQDGIKTVFVTPEYGGKEGDELPLLFGLPEADAIISTGSLERRLELPAPDKVIGPGGAFCLLDLDISPGREAASATGPLSLDGRYDFTGGIDWLGASLLTCYEY